MNGRLAMAAFLHSVRINAADYDEVVVYLAGLIEQEREIETIFHIALLMTDCIKPGLKDGYIRFPGRSRCLRRRETGISRSETRRA